MDENSLDGYYIKADGNTSGRKILFKELETKNTKHLIDKATYSVHEVLDNRQKLSHSI